MDVKELVHTLDVKHATPRFGIENSNAVVCPNEGKGARLPQSGYTSAEHGYMVVHSSGQYLVCGLCDAKYPTVVSL